MDANEYNGTIEVIAGFKPINNGNFPLMESHDILFANGEIRLDALLAGFTGSIKEYIDDKIAEFIESEKMQETITTTMENTGLTIEEYDDAIYEDNTCINSNTINSDEDLNNLTSEGVYYVEDINIIIDNKPSDVNDTFRLECKQLTESQGLMQILYPYNTPTNFYIRYYKSNQWGSWYKYSGVEIS